MLYALIAVASAPLFFFAGYAYAKYGVPPMVNRFGKGLTAVASFGGALAVAVFVH